MKTKDIQVFAKNLFAIVFKCLCVSKEVILDIVFPKKCIFCSRLIPAGSRICICKKCISQPAQQAEIISDANTACEEVICSLKYDGNVRDAMLEFKFSGVKYIGSTFAKTLSDLADGRKFLTEDCIITAVPVHTVRDRAYNQSEVIAKEFCAFTGKEYCDCLIYKIRPINKISGMNRVDKEFFSIDSFHINSGYNISGKTVVIIDDICTSGTTLRELASKLYSRGAKAVYGIAACYREIKQITER